MKVMHILNTGAYSGAENVVISIITHTRNDVESIYVSPKGTIESVLNENGIRYYPVNKLSVHSISKAIRRENPNIIHAHDFTASVLVSLCKTGIPIISHLHNNPPWIKKINFKTIAYCFSCFRYKKILTVSEAVMSEYCFGNFFEKKIKILGNPVIIGDIISKSRIAERNESFDVLFLGRLTIQKNPERFLEIMNKVKLHIPSFTVGMIGNGEMYELVKQKIKELNLEDTVSMLGFISNPYGVLRNSKILCMPSSWEGFGLVAIEALALGKPVVAADVGGLPGIINSESGKLCNATEEYVDEICSLLSNKHYYETKSLNALKQSEKLDNSYQYFADLITIYLTYV